MESKQICPVCKVAMSHYDNDPSPIELDCLHEVCLNCINKLCNWNPQQNEIKYDFVCPLEDCKKKMKLSVKDENALANKIRKQFQKAFGQIKKIDNKIVCSSHTEKQIEFFCTYYQCKKFGCFKCVILHQSHLNSINNMTEKEILADNEDFIKYSDIAIIQLSKTLKKIKSTKEELLKIKLNDEQFESEHINQIYGGIQSLLLNPYQNALQNLKRSQLYLYLSFEDSKICVTQEQKNLILSLFEKPYDLNLLLRGSVHGFESKIFHKKCDNKEKILCIVKDTKNKIFGAYSDISFNKSGQLINNNKKSFIYIFKENNIFEKSQCLDQNNEIQYIKNKSMTLGNLPNFVIENYCDKRPYNKIQFEKQNEKAIYSYIDLYSSQMQNSFYDRKDDYSFTVQEIEYYQVNELDQ